MNVIRINRDEYRDKVLACWLGKNIGGTLGAASEGKRYTHNFSFYDPVPTEPMPNDDLDLQMVWLKMVEEQGLTPSMRTFADYWNRYSQRWSCNEYGFFLYNFARGLRPPVAGCFENYFVDEMGSPIRSEIWACLNPGDPDSAAQMAWRDSCMDHSGGEGMYGEMFWAAMEAAAFVEKDLRTLLRIGLNMIPHSCRIARVIREAIWCYDNGVSWGEAREKIYSIFGGTQACDAVPNHGFEIIGLLYGKDFGDCLCKAVNCGYDTDCTAATLGSFLGILGGTEVIPERWLQPIGEKIILHEFTKPCDAPEDVQKLTDRLVRLRENAVSADSEILIGDYETNLPDDIMTRLFTNDQAKSALKRDLCASVELLDGREVWFYYGGEPVLFPGIWRKVKVEVEGDPSAGADLIVPEGWECRKLDNNEFMLYSEKAVAARNRIEVVLNGKKTAFTVLGPDEVCGFPAGENVPRCPDCGVVEALGDCLCRK